MCTPGRVIEGCTDLFLTTSGGPPHVLVRIEALALRPGYPNFGQPKAWLSIMNVLVHETVHAYFFIFTCHCRRCFLDFRGSV